MKLSELFRTPFKLKGGSTLNLRGFSKRVADKEIGEGGKSESGVVYKIIEQFYNTQMIPHSSKFYDVNTRNIINISDIILEGYYKFLYKKSDYTEFPLNGYINTTFTAVDNTISLEFIIKNDTNIVYETIIDGEIYVALQQ